MHGHTRKVPLRILFVNSIQMFGGGEIWMLTAMKALHNRGHVVGLLCRPDTELENRCRQLTFPTFTIPIRGDFDPVTIFKFYKVIKNFGADVLLTNMDKELRLAGIAKQLLKETVLIPRRGIDYPLKNHLIYRLTYNKWADGIIANSMATKKALLRNTPWLSPAKIKVIYNGIDPKRFFKKSNSLRDKLDVSPDDFVFGFAGQLDERKGISTLLAAFHQVIKKKTNVKLLLAGEGTLRNVVEDYIEKHQLNGLIYVLGFQDDIPQFMANINALVLPSLWEGFGIVLIEAMAAHKPVISSRTSNIPEIVEDGEVGLLIEPENVDELSAAMEFFLDNPRKVRTMGNAGRMLVEERFSLDRMIDELEVYFYQFVNA